MDKQSNAMSKLRRFTTILLLVLLVLAASYMGLLAYSILNHAYKTETAITYTMSDSIYLDGVAVFDSVDVAGGGTLGYLVADGERVTDGTVLAERYTENGQGILRERLDRLGSTISLLNKSQNSAGSDLSVLTNQSRVALYNLLDQLDGQNYSQISAAQEDFLLAQNRLQISTGQADGFGDAIATLQAEYDTVAAQINGLEKLVASTNGYFVSSAVYAPLQLDTQTLENAAPAELQAMLATGLPRSGEAMAGRIVTGFSWRFFAVCSAEQAARLQQVSRVQISVPGKQDTPLAAAVTSVELDEEAGVAKVLFTCESINADVLSLGQETAQIDLQTYTGIRIDRSALHIVNGAHGVYVKYGNLQRFRKITVLYENENYLLVPLNGAVGTDNEVRLYDEIIVEGKNLQDGKLL